MLKTLVNLFKTRFVHAFFTVSFGNLLAQIINFGIQPIVTRLYSTVQFGEFALFSSLLSIFCVLFTLAYDQAIIAAKDENDSQKILYGTLYISFIFCFVFLIIGLFFEHNLLALLKLSNGMWLYLLPINIFFMIVFNVYNSYLYVVENYKLIGNTACLNSLINGIAQVVLFYASIGAVGLALGKIISLLVCAGLVWILCIKNKLKKFNCNFDAVKSILIKNYQFPCYQLPASFVNHFLDTAITFTIVTLYSKSILGLYALVIQVLSIPISMISGTLRQLTISEFRKVIDDKPKIRALYFKFFVGLLILIVIPMMILFIYGEDIFLFAFGNSWEGIGKYVSILVPLYIIRFVAFPLSGIVLILKKQNYFLIFQLMLLSNCFIQYILASYLCLQVTDYFICLSVSMTMLYFIQIFVYFKLIK